MSINPELGHKTLEFLAKERSRIDQEREKLRREAEIKHIEEEGFREVTDVLMVHGKKDEHDLEPALADYYALTLKFPSLPLRKLPELRLRTESVAVPEIPDTELFLQGTIDFGFAEGIDDSSFSSIKVNARVCGEERQLFHYDGIFELQESRLSVGKVHEANLDLPPPARTRILAPYADFLEKAQEARNTVAFIRSKLPRSREVRAGIAFLKSQ